MSDSPTKIKLLARAKLNLSLDITGQRRDGYHLMDMVMRSVDLSDELTLRLAESGGISIASNMRFLPRGEKNLAFRAAQSLCASVGMPLPSLHIDIKKNIPTQAGLGGGSADAAAVLVGLNTLFSLGLSCDELCAVGETIGADVPFCVCGGTARVRGIGELIEPIEDNCSYTVLILMPALGRSTHEAFARWNTDAIFNHPDVSGTVNALRTGDIAELGMLICNAFSLLELDETTERLKSALLRAGAFGASMTGSGAAVFGLFPNNLSAKNARSLLFDEASGSHLAHPCPEGVKIVSLE